MTDLKTKNFKECMHRVEEFFNAVDVTNNPGLLKKRDVAKKSLEQMENLFLMGEDGHHGQTKCCTPGDKQSHSGSHCGCDPSQSN